MDMGLAAGRDHLQMSHGAAPDMDMARCTGEVVAAPVTTAANESMEPGAAAGMDMGLADMDM
eukprot:6648366-Karenia_brevis.AAC.1